MKKIEVTAEAMDRFRETGVKREIENSGFYKTVWNPNDNLLCWENNGKEAEWLLKGLRRIVKKRFVIRQIGYSPECNAVTFYVYSCRFMAWLDGWDNFEREGCGTYDACHTYWYGQTFWRRIQYRMENIGNLYCNDDLINLLNDPDTSPSMRLKLVRQIEIKEKDLGYKDTDFDYSEEHKAKAFQLRKWAVSLFNKIFGIKTVRRVYADN
jgi:hypothetical protein